MGWPFVDLVRIALLDDLSEIHDSNPVADMADDRQIVGNEEIGDTQLLLQISEQVDHLGLGRDIERAHRLIAHEQFRLEREGPCDSYALALAS